MPPVPEKYQEILSALDNGTTIVTGSSRLARELSLHYADYRSRQLTVWERPAVVPWAEWLRRLWFDLGWQAGAARQRRLLSAGHKKILWEQIIREAEGAEGLLQVHAVARAASEAWDIAWAWEMPWEEAAELASEDASRFLVWANTYTELCAREGWLDDARLPEALTALLGAGELRQLPAAVLLVGFDELTPQQQSFSRHLAESGISLSRHQPTIQPLQVTVVSAADSETELVAAAHWCLQRLESEDSATVGVVVPELSGRHEEVSRIFAEVLSPGASERIAAEAEPVFSVSASAPLASHPMIATALDLLALTDVAPQWSQVSHVLRSPFLGDALAEADCRAALDVSLRKKGGRRWPLAWLDEVLADETASDAASNSPALKRRLRAALDLQSAWPTKQTPREWVLHISAWLNAFGWPGERTLSSAEYQAQQRWRELLEEVAGYDELLGALRLEAILALIRNLARSAAFKPESPRCPVLVLGVLEAAGLEFDHLWVSGLHDNAWPPAPAPTPFIPHTLQRALNMPRGSAARELQFARLQLDRMVHSAGAVRLSWPQADGEETLRPSSLLDAYSPQVLSADANLALQGRSRDIFDARPRLQAVPDGLSPACEDGKAVSGGVRVLELQAQCPFRAYAELRLDAAPLEQPVAGLDAINRGSVAHDSLFYLWGKLSGQEALQNLNASDRDRLIRQSVGQAVARVETRGNVLLRRLLEMESSRLAGLLSELLELELERPLFVVERREKRQQVRVGPLRLTVRPDRVDELPGAGQLVIDYKTGSVSAGDWFGSRPKAPQLPLYATSLGLPEVLGIAFVQLQAGNVKFTGVCAADAAMPRGVKVPQKNQLEKQGAADWPTLLTSWRTVLGQLARDFQAGASPVDPLPNACTFCHLQNLCRVEEKKRSGEVSVNG